MIRTGQDQALVIPYINVILLYLGKDQWLRNLDVTPLQPLVVGFDEGPVRRAANNLLALEYRKDESSSAVTFKSTVNEIAFEKLKEYARRGELHSTALREELLSMLFISERVCIRALSFGANEVFDSDKMLAGPLITSVSEPYHQYRVTCDYNPTTPSAPRNLSP